MHFCACNRKLRQLARFMAIATMTDRSVERYRYANSRASGKISLAHTDALVFHLREVAFAWQIAVDDRGETRHIFVGVRDKEVTEAKALACPWT